MTVELVISAQLSLPHVFTFHPLPVLCWVQVRVPKSQSTQLCHLKLVWNVIDHSRDDIISNTICQSSSFAMTLLLVVDMFVDLASWLFFFISTFWLIHCILLSWPYLLAIRSPCYCLWSMFVCELSCSVRVIVDSECWWLIIEPWVVHYESL